LHLSPFPVCCWTNSVTHSPCDGVEAILFLHPRKHPAFSPLFFFFLQSLFFQVTISFKSSLSVIFFLFPCLGLVPRIAVFSFPDFVPCSLPAPSVPIYVFGPPPLTSLFFASFFFVRKTTSVLLLFSRSGRVFPPFLLVQQDPFEGFGQLPLRRLFFRCLHPLFFFSRYCRVKGDLFPCISRRAH